jgi:RimJ/RimL family protein N-acetyltransferase
MFSGQLVRLGALLPEHMTTLAEWDSNTEIQRLLQDSPMRPQTPAQRDEWYKVLSKDHNYPFAIFTQSTEGNESKLIGQGGILWPDVKNRSGHIVVIISDPDSRGKGFGSEAIRLLVNYAFCELNLNRLEAEIFSFNEPAVRAAEKAGFTRELMRRQVIFRDGSYHDSYLFSILRSDWKGSNN